MFYLLFIAGMVFFVTGREGTVMQAVMRGAFFGLICYATYDLTNLATIKDWPVLVTVVDMCWGTILGAGTGGIAVWLKAIL